MREFLATNRIKLFDAQGYPLRSERYATLRAVRRGETVLQQQETIRRPNNSNLPVLVNALVVHQDVTVLKETEYLKDEFVGIVAHELRTPLAVLRGFADMLLVQTARGRGPALADWQQEALGEIEVAVTRLVQLTEDLLDVTRLQTGRLLLQRTPTNVASLARRVATSLQRAGADQPGRQRHQVQPAGGAGDRHPLGGG